ncbi:hypothetical protein AMTR_s00037p00229780 [Amborella trichopoda]|uniref:Uncharacterized protein n=1 Tax=Amborella trichopoda TaxID=13333 RepID=U5DAJ7_AMBTC|nr:hypothetical protein AMTR_s00037p00229780 [Amborella trichopoda]
MSHEAWTELNMRMAWETCLRLMGLSKFVVPHYGRVGHVTESYQWWWDITNRLYWHSDYPWQRELTKPRALDKDDAGPEYLSLKGETKSSFDDLRSIFGLTKGGTGSGYEGRLVQGLDALIGSGPGSGLTAKPRRTSLLPPRFKHARVEACIVVTPPPAASTLASRVDPETVMARPEGSGSISFILRRELGGTPSRGEVEATPPADCPVGSSACSPMSPGDILHAFTEEGNGEAVNELSTLRQWSRVCLP